MAAARGTIDHRVIRDWVEQRNGWPAAVVGSGAGEDPGILRIDLPGVTGEGNLERISWERFFDWFEANQQAFLYQQERGSRFNKLVSRTSARLPRPSGRQEPRRTRAAPNALKLLEQQHREIEAWFARVETDAADKSQPFAALADVLAAHTHIEEQIFYPTLLSEDSEELLHRFVEEHLFMKRMLTDLMEEGSSDAAFDNDLDALRQLVQRHVTEEEDQLFPLARGIDPDALSALGEMMSEAYDGLMEGEPRRDLPGEMELPSHL